MNAGTLKAPKRAKTKTKKAMERTIIALWGISNQGKTTTIRRVYDELRKRKGNRLIDPGSPSRTEVNGAILEIDGVLVGFASPGDVEWILAANLLPLVEAGCAVIVCATHTRGGTVDLVERVASESERPFGIVWIEKVSDYTDHAVGNRVKADEIIETIYRAIETA